jgi:hypothetical protein
MPHAPIRVAGSDGRIEHARIPSARRGAVHGEGRAHARRAGEGDASAGQHGDLVREPMSLAVRDHLDGADIVLVDKIDPAKIDAALLDIGAGRLRRVRAELAESSRKRSCPS